jgi:hypothetical protein
MGLDGGRLRHVPFTVVDTKVELASGVLFGRTCVALVAGLDEMRVRTTPVVAEPHL